MRNYAVKDTGRLNFAGEKVPLSDEEVFERMDRELLVNSYWHSNTMQNLKLAHRWFPVIEETFKGIRYSSDFKIHSPGRKRTQKCGISGWCWKEVWQFLPETARHFDLRVDDEVDERYDVQKATVAAARNIFRPPTTDWAAGPWRRHLTMQASARSRTASNTRK